MTNTAATSKVVRVRRYAARKASVALVVALVAVGLVGPVLVVGLVAPPADAATTTTPHIVVNSELDWADLDPNDGICDATASLDINCTLRAAIQQANAHPGPDVIDFDISGLIRDPVTGVATIPVGTPLPVITDPVVVNGYSQQGSQVNTLAKGTNAKPLIEITPAAGFESVLNTGGITVGIQDVTIRGLVINRFSTIMPGIEVSPTITHRPVSNVKIQGNFIGTDPSGTIDEGNGQAGVNIRGASNVTVGGSTLPSRNLISGNDVQGVLISGATNADLDPANNNLVRGNLIGTQKDGLKLLANRGAAVIVADTANLTNGAHDANGNTILSNSIFSNGFGIDLAGDVKPTANDAGDADAGANRWQNKPVLSAAKTVSGTTTVKGTLNSRPTETYTVQFFSSPSGNQGRTFLGSKIVKTDASDKASFTFSPSGKVAAGQRVTATATRTKTGDTSEFSAPRTVVSS
jgi:trimeric autotransporter adhesin